MRPALDEDGPILRCMACVLRMADWATKPEKLDYELAKDLSALHGDLVELVTEVDGQLFVHPFFGTVFRPNGETRVVWKFNEDAFVAGVLPPYAEHSTPYPDCVDEGCQVHPFVM